MAEMLRREAEIGQRLEAMNAVADDFQVWADGLRVATKQHVEELEEKSVDAISQNNFMMNRMVALMELEEATLKNQGCNGILVAEDQLDMLKNEVHVYTAELWKQAALSFQEQLSKPIQKFKIWFEMAGEMAMKRENQELRRQLDEMQIQLEASQSREHGASVIEGVIEPGLLEKRKPVHLLMSAATSPLKEMQSVAEKPEDKGVGSSGVDVPVVEQLTDAVKTNAESEGVAKEADAEKADQGIVDVGPA